MILNPKTHLADSETMGVQESMSMTIDTSDQVALMSILSENLYKDPIGSLVRESTSNALDTHKEAGTTDPIIVSLQQDSNYNYIFSVQDFGTGITPQVVKDVLSKYAASTKRNSNEYLGYYGLGFKAPLAYTDSFVFTTRVGGIEYTYMMYKSEEGTKIDLVSEKADTSGKTGTTVRVQLQSRNDYQEFINKIRQQLAYFEGVYFNVPGISNDFKIIKNEDWKYSSLTPHAEMHICLDNVHYSIDWERLGLKKINSAIGLNFNIEDGLLPIPSREDIKYTEESKELIRIKIKAVADFFMKKFNESRVEADDFRKIYTLFNVRTVDIEGIQFDTLPLEKYSNIKAENPTLKGIKLLDLKDLSGNIYNIFNNYTIRGRISSHSFTGKYKTEADEIIGWNSPNKATAFILAKESPKGLQLEYLKDKFSHAVFVYKDREMKLGQGYNRYSWDNDHYTYKNLLHLDKYSKGSWRQVITEFQSITNKMIDELPKLEDLQPTKEWLEERKAKRAKGQRKKVDNLEINIWIGRKAERGDSILAFDSHTIKVKDAGKLYQSLIVYGGKSDKDRLGELYPLIRPGEHHSRKRKFTLAMLSNFDAKKVKGLSNFITINEFMKGNNRPFKAFATALLIEKLERDNSRVFRSTEFISLLYSTFSSNMEKLIKYRDDNYPSNYYNNSDGFLTEVLKVATEGNLFDDTIMTVYNEVSDKIADFDFIEVINNEDLVNKTSKALSISREILKGRGLKLDWGNPTPEITSESSDPEDNDEEEESDHEIAEIGSFLDIEREEDEIDQDNMEETKGLEPVLYSDEVF